MTQSLASVDQSTIVTQALTAAIEPHDYELVRNLGRVLGIQPTQEVLLLSSDEALQQALAGEFRCHVTAVAGDMQQLPFADGYFDSVVVACALPNDLLPLARELARVTKWRGTLGMIVLNVHADYVAHAEGNASLLHRMLARPAAAYRAVLAESGWTAFVSTPRNNDLLRPVRDTYRQHLLAPVSDATPADEQPQALRLLAANGVNATLITAEQAA